VRMLDPVAWADAGDLVQKLIDQILAPYGVRNEVTYVRGVPPVVNEPHATALMARAVEGMLGEEAHVPTVQSLGGEDFAWYCESIPGAMGRLGTRTPGGRTYDLHQGNLVVDEGSVAIGAKVLAGVAVQALVAQV
ncbi:MAG: M20/M25/M40 family metallo-hydrolase, partial [Nocardioides sp.]